MIRPKQMANALREAERITGKKLDILAFDCCLMASTEVAYELKDVASFMVASEETEGGAGWPYNKVLSEKSIEELQKALRSKINIAPGDFARKIVEDAATVQQALPTMSAVDLSKMGDVAVKIDEFAQAILDTKTPMIKIKNIVYNTGHFKDFRDLYDFLEKLSKSDEVDDENLKNAAREVMKSLDTAIIANEHSGSHPYAHGLHIEIPTWAGFSKGYDELAFARDTKWDEAMKKPRG
jgi:hypothetical protein